MTRDWPGPDLDVRTESTGNVRAVGRAARAIATRSRSRELWLLAGVLVALTLVLRLPAFFVDVFNSDETFLATQAHVIR